MAGVSLSTVSRVVNGSPPVDPELAAKVERAIELLGYRHNHTAGTLRRANGLSSTIAPDLRGRRQSRSSPPSTAGWRRSRASGRW